MTRWFVGFFSMPETTFTSCCSSLSSLFNSALDGSSDRATTPSNPIASGKSNSITSLLPL